MRNLWRFIKRDAHHIKGNVIALVVLVGLIVVPSFYAWFNIAGGWDPYNNTKNLKIAVANTDEGYSSDLMPISLNMGERVVSDLRESKSIGYSVTSEDEAREGVRSGAYYAAIVIPPDFSNNMLTILSSNLTHPQVGFYQNVKANPIAQIVTNKASSSVQHDIDSAFAQSVASVGAGTLSELSSYLSDDNLAKLASTLDTTITDSQKSLNNTAANMRSYGDVLGSTQALLQGGSSTATTSLTSTLSIGSTLRDSAGGVRNLGDALDGSVTSLNTVLVSSSSHLDDVTSALNHAFDVTDAQSGQLSDALTQAKTAYIQPATTKLQSVSTSLADTDTLFAEYETSIPAGTIGADAIHEARISLQNMKAKVDQSITELKDLSDEIDTTVQDIASGTASSKDARTNLTHMVERAKSDIQGAQTTYDQDVRGSLNSLARDITSAADTSDHIVSSLSGTLSTVTTATSDASSSLGDAQSSLVTGATSLEQASTKLGDIHTQLHTALDSGDITQVRKILSADPSSLASFIANPLSVDRTAVFPVENNGSAMAPFYSVLSIWIGGVILCALLKANPSKRALEETGCTPTQSYLGRIVLFLIVGFLQTSVICGGDLFFLGVHCEHPLLFLLVGWLTSFAFINIVYALTASFGDVGKAIAVILMVMQVAGSGGTFPKEMLPAAFQTVYPFLPFVHAENAMRSAMFGIYNGDIWIDLARLLAFVIPSLLLGLVLRRPVIRLNEWVEHKLASTQVM